MSNGSQANLNNNKMAYNEGVSQPDVEAIAMKNELEALMEKLAQMNKVSLIDSISNFEQFRS